MFKFDLDPAEFEGKAFELIERFTAKASKSALALVGVFGGGLCLGALVAGRIIAAEHVAKALPLPEAAQALLAAATVAANEGKTQAVFVTPEHAAMMIDLLAEKTQGTKTPAGVVQKPAKG